MASNCARKLVQRSVSSSRTFLNRTQTSAAGPSKLNGLANAVPSPAARHHRQFFSAVSRLPVELGCSQSLMPFHSATASSLLKSMLSSEVGQWGCLSEGFATPL